MNRDGCINWEAGFWERPAGQTGTAEIVIAGDWAPIRDFSDTILENPEAVYGDLLPLLRECDLRIVNLESPLVDGGEPIHKSGTVLKGVAGHVKGLHAVPFEVVTLANNHVFDYGADGFKQTRTLLDQNGIQYTGAGMSLAEAQKPLVIDINGIQIGIISFSEGEDLTGAGPQTAGVFGWEVEKVIALVKEIRPAVNAVIVVCHGGVEYIPFPPPYLAGALRRIAASGADLVIGHHPHVPQGVEIYQGVPICYSLGNFVFFQPSDIVYRKIGYLVKAGVAKDGLTGIRIVPYEIEAKRLMLLKGEKLAQAFKKLAVLSEPLNRPGGAEAAWHGFLKHYGIEGFKKEIADIMACFESELPKGAAMFRNRLTTLQHYHHFIDLMTRIMDGSLDKAPDWATTVAADFLTRKVSEGLPE